MDDNSIRPHTEKYMITISEFRCKLIGSLIAVEVGLRTILFILGIVVITDDATKSCVAKSDTDKHFFYTFIFVGIVDFFFSVSLTIIKCPLKSKMFIFTNYTIASMLLVDLLCEVAFFTVKHCLNQAMAPAIIARAILIFIMVLSQLANFSIICCTVYKEHAKNLFYMIEFMIWAVLVPVGFIFIIVLEVIILTNIGSMKKTD